MTEKIKLNISYLLASIIIAYLGFAFIGIQLGISAIIYDEQRLLQFILLIAASTYLICTKNTLSKQACYTLSIALLKLINANKNINIAIIIKVQDFIFLKPLVNKKIVEIMIIKQLPIIPVNNKA